jgi:hypothetical protein
MVPSVPDPIFASPIAVTAIISAADPVRNTSSAPSTLETHHLLDTCSPQVRAERLDHEAHA